MARSGVCRAFSTGWLRAHRRRADPCAVRRPLLRPGHLRYPVRRLQAPAPRPRRPLTPIRTTASGSHDGAPSRDYAGGGPYFCVRMCDGRYFPIGNRAGASAVELCRSFCPNAPTQIFSGSKIDHSVAPGGQALFRNSKRFRLSREDGRRLQLRRQERDRTGPARSAGRPNLAPRRLCRDRTGLDGLSRRQWFHHGILRDFQRAGHLGKSARAIERDPRRVRQAAA